MIESKNVQNITQAELNQLKQVTSIDEWSDVVKEIKRKRGWEMPPDWMTEVLE